MRELAKGSVRFLVMGDTKSPGDFSVEGCEFHSFERQRESGFRYARLCPEKSYTRKNLGYLEAIRGGAQVVLETDDDNYPCAGFWS